MRLITAKNIKNGFLQKEPEEFVNPNIYNSWMTRGIPQKGDILFTTEAPLANIAQLDNLSDEIKNLKATYQHKLNDLEELKKSILQKAFDGQL